MYDNVYLQYIWSYIGSSTIHICVWLINERVFYGSQVVHIQMNTQAECQWAFKPHTHSHKLTKAHIVCSLAIASATMQHSRLFYVCISVIYVYDINTHAGSNASSRVLKTWARCAYVYYKFCIYRIYNVHFYIVNTYKYISLSLFMQWRTSWVYA